MRACECVVTWHPVTRLSHVRPNRRTIARVSDGNGQSSGPIRPYFYLCHVMRCRFKPSSRSDVINYPYRQALMEGIGWRVTFSPPDQCWQWCCRRCRLLLGRLTECCSLPDHGRSSPDLLRHTRPLFPLRHIAPAIVEVCIHYACSLHSQPEKWIPVEPIGGVDWTTCTGLILALWRM